MIHFFGILDPSNGKRHRADDAPGKSAFFGRKEQVEKQPEPTAGHQELEEDLARERKRFLMQSFSPQF